MAPVQRQPRQRAAAPSKDGSATYICRGDIHTALSLLLKSAPSLGTALTRTSLADLSQILRRFLPTAEAVEAVPQKTRFRAGN